MQRRTFLRSTSAALAGGVLAACGAERALLQPHVRLNAAWYRANRRFVPTSYGRIAYVEHGAGEAALFLHGFPLNSFQWRGALERLAPHRRCVAPDFLGMGYTEPAEGRAVAPEDQVRMLIELLEALSIRQVDVVANDSGGAVAQLLLVRHPERVRTLLLTNCDTEIDSPPPALLPVIALAREGKFVDEWLAPWRADTALARSPQGIGGMCYADPAHPTDEAIEYYFAPLLRSERTRAFAHAYAVALERNPLVGSEAVFRRSTTPTRIVWGVADDIFSRDSPAYLDRTFGGSRGVRRLDGRKLFWPEEAPEVIAQEARRLWSL